MGFCYLPPESVKMGQRSLWAAVVYPLTVAVNSKKDKEQGQNGQRVKMGFCYLPPEKVKMWAAAVYPLTESN